MAVDTRRTRLPTARSDAGEVGAGSWAEATTGNIDKTPAMIGERSVISLVLIPGHYEQMARHAAPSVTVSEASGLPADGHDSSDRLQRAPASCGRCPARVGR